MSLSSMEMVDCQTVCKTFEKGANSCMTEGSVYAVMTPTVSSSKLLASTTKNTIKKNKIESSSLPNSATKTSETTKLGGVLNSKCIPCSLRVNFKEQLSLNQLFSMSSEDPLTQALIKNFEQTIGNFKQIIDMLTNKNKYVDLCSFLKFVNDFLCVPDIQRILAALSALLMKMALEINAFFDIILQLVGPMLLPFFMVLLDTINKFIQLAIAPLECIVNAITNMMNKLDYNVIFKNLQNMEVTLGNNVNGKVEFNLAGPLNAIQTKQQLEVEKAKNNLDKTRSTQMNIRNQQSNLAYQANVKAAKENYQAALDNRDLSKIGQAQESMNKTFSSMKSSLASLQYYLRQAMEEFEDLWNKWIEEGMKLLSSLSGNGTGLLISLENKLAIVQLISLLASLLSAIKNGVHCNQEGKELETYLNYIPPNEDFEIIVDKNGKTIIAQQNQNLVDSLRSALSGKDAEGTPTEVISSFKTLIKYTGKEVIDSKINQTVETLVTPVKIEFNCPSYTSGENAEKINKWIKELGTV